jgi:hypothetical protein
MRYENFYDPIAHLVIDDFFTTDEYDEVFDIINSLKGSMEPGVYVDHRGDRLEEKINVMQKKNFNIFPKYSTDSIACKRIIEILENKFWSYEMREIYLTNKDSMFQYHHYNNSNEIMISLYPKNGHYDWHRDINRSLTGSVMISNDQVEGGNFYLKNNFGQIKEIEFKTNRVIFFPAECKHMVSPVTNDTERFSIQYFTQYKRQYLNCE